MKTVFTLLMVIIPLAAKAQTFDPRATAAMTILNDEKNAVEQRAVSLFTELQNTKQQLAEAQKKLAVKDRKKP